MRLSPSNAYPNDKTSARLQRTFRGLDINLFQTCVSIRRSIYGTQHPTLSAIYWFLDLFCFLPLFISWFLGSKVSWFLGFKMSWFQSVLVSWFQSFLVSEFRGFLVSWFLGFTVSWFQSFLVSKLQ